jgi:hypothetical protein
MLAPKPLPKRLEIKRMTVCMAALAANSKALVCIADKALSYGETITWDSDSSKMFTLNPSGTLVLFAGGERDTGEIIARLIASQDKIGTSKSETKKKIEAESKDAIDFLVDRLYLSPRQLKREEYVAAISGQQINSHIRKVAEEIDEFSLGCHLIVCGSDSGNLFILNMDSSGIATDMSMTGFHAIGSGWEQAIGRLLFSEHERKHSVGRVLYDCVDAKFGAELDPSVGYEWDAWVMLPGKLGTYPVPKKIKDLVESAWAKFSRSPFEKYDRKVHKPGPPKGWEKTLEEFSELITKASLNNPAAKKKLRAMADSD